MKNIFTLLLLFTGTCCYAQKVKLGLNLQLDSTYYLTSNANLTIDQNIGGTHQLITTAITGKMAHKVIAIRDTVYEMEVKYKHLVMHMEVAGKTIDFGTGTEKDDLFSKIMGALIDKPIGMLISRSGRVLEIKHPEALYTSMFDAFPQITAEQKAQFLAQMQQAFGEKAIRGNFQDAFIIFPDTELSLNSTWNTNTVLESAGIAAKTKMTYTLSSTTGNAYVINGNAVITSDNNNPEYKKTSTIEVRYINFKGSGTAELKLNKKTNWIEETKVVKNIDGTAQIKDTPATPGGMTIPMSIIATLLVNSK